MKKLLALLFVLFCLPVFGQDLIYYQDSTATDSLKLVPVSGLTPLPVDAVVTIGSVTVSPSEPPDQNQTDVISVTSSSQNITSIANRKTINVINHSPTETIWLSLDSAVASATVGASIPIFPYGFFGVELDASKVASVITSTTATVTVYQDGY